MRGDERGALSPRRNEEELTGLIFRIARAMAYAMRVPRGA